MDTVFQVGKWRQLKVRIASPCTESWDEMKRVDAADRVRHCASCKLNVFNTRNLSEAELMKLLEDTTGRVCGRVWLRPDGTALTKDCPEGMARVRRRVAVALSLAVSAVFAALGYGVVKGKKACQLGGDATWFDRVVMTRAYEAREELRDTKTLGPLIEALDPRPVAMPMMGKMVRVTPKTPAP